MVTPDTVILQRTVNPVVTGVPGGCDFGSSAVQFLNATTFAQTDLIDEIGGSPIAALRALSMATRTLCTSPRCLARSSRIGAPRATSAGDDTANGNMNQTAGAGSTSYESPFTLMGWRVVL